MSERGLHGPWDRTDVTVPGLDRVHLVVYNATGSGGVARSVTMLAGSLADHHEVHLHSLLRTTDEPTYGVDPRVQVNWMIDARRSGGHRGRPRHDRLARRSSRRQDRQPSLLEDEPGASRHTDEVLRRELSRLAPGVLVTTRPMLHLAAARWATGRLLHVAQDHLNFEVRMRKPVITSLLDNAVPSADALVTLTRADQRDYQRRYADILVKHIPNASPFALREPAPLAEQVVVAAGRLVARKGFDRLLDAWRPLAEEFRGWRLDIYGEGECRPALERQVERLGLLGRVRLPGHTAHLDEVLSGASLFAMSSRAEGFPMVLLEAMSHGLPLVSFDCPRGPAEIVEDGVTGRLVADGDLAGFTDALRGLMTDPRWRRRLGDAAHARAASYESGTVAEQWENLFEEVRDRRMERASERGSA